MTESFSWRRVVAIAIFAAIWLAMLLGGTGPLDRSVYEHLYAGHRPALGTIAHVLTALGEPTVLIAASVLCAAWLWYTGRGRVGLALLFVALIGRGLSEVQKVLVDRPRPSLEPHLVMVKTQSFPSGHANSSMIFYLTLAILLTPERGRTWAIAAAVLLSLMIGTSRVMLGVHWPSDVVGAWAYGVLWVLIALHPLEGWLHADSATT